MNKIREALQSTVRTVTRFNRAELVNTGNGNLELRGGTASDRIEAKEWISLFMHEAVLKAPHVSDSKCRRSRPLLATRR